jgi:hypothetical protein
VLQSSQCCKAQIVAKFIVLQSSECYKAQSLNYWVIHSVARVSINIYNASYILKAHSVAEYTLFLIY